MVHLQTGLGSRSEEHAGSWGKTGPPNAGRTLPQSDEEESAAGVAAGVLQAAPPLGLAPGGGLCPARTAGGPTANAYNDCGGTRA